MLLLLFTCVYSRSQKKRDVNDSRLSVFLRWLLHRKNANAYIAGVVGGKDDYGYYQAVEFERYLARRATMRELPDDDAVFVNNKGGRLTARSVERIVERDLSSWYRTA